MQIPALFLTFDRDLDVALYCLHQFARVWPSCPVKFVVPVNSKPAHTKLLSEAPENLSVTAVQTAFGMKATLTSLLVRAENSDWIFWCSSDRYPYAALAEELSAVTDAIADGPPVDGAICSIRIARWRDRGAVVKGHTTLLGGEPFEQAKFGKHGIWIPNFMRRTLLVDMVTAMSSDDDLYEFHRQFVERAESSSAQILIPTRALMKVEEPIRHGKFTLNFAAREPRVARTREIDAVTMIYSSPAMPQTNNYWARRKIKAEVVLSAELPPVPFVVVSSGGTGAKHLVKCLCPNALPSVRQRAQTYRRIPPLTAAFETQRILYVFDDPRDAVISIFSRRAGRHMRHGFGEPVDAAIVAPAFALRHAENLEVNAHPMTSNWGIEEYVSHGVDLFRLEEHFDLWRYSPAAYPVLFVESEALSRRRAEIETFLQHPLGDIPLAPRSSNWRATPQAVRKALNGIYGEFAARLDELPDAFVSRAGQLTALTSGMTAGSKLRWI